jgi:aldose sugar dehydrogenase
MKVPNTPENHSRCICPGCPTYDDCMAKGGENLFCAAGKSACEFDSMGCICGECPVGSDYRLSDLYYCRG